MDTKLEWQIGLAITKKCQKTGVPSTSYWYCRGRTGINFEVEYLEKPWMDCHDFWYVRSLGEDECSEILIMLIIT